MGAIQEQIHAPGAGGRALELPCLSGIAVCNAECLKQIIGFKTHLFDPMGGAYIVEDGGTQSAKAQSSPVSADALEWWNKLINRILTVRFNDQQITYCVSPGAETVLAAAHSREFQALWQKYNLIQYLGVDLSVRLMLVLHVCQGHPGKEIPEATAQNAVTIAAWLLEENQRVLRELKTEELAEKRQIDCAVMLGKILEKGPISQRDLFRCYDNQGQVRLKPILDDLIQVGAVVRDEDGRFRASAMSEDGGKSSIELIANKFTARTDTADMAISDEQR
jgi:hypothetical protein